MASSGKPFRVLFVCMGNICRSPAADIVFRHKVHHAGLEKRIEIDSAGTIGHHTGCCPDPRMSATLTRRGYTPLGEARQVLATDLDSFDLILAMDDDNFRDLRELDPTAARHGKIRRFTDFCERHDDTYVPDPYYGGAHGFEHVADLVEDGAEGLLKWILSHEEKP